ncbi:sigma-70 family RNA polymerase sigma factor [Priestia taiwanensis]|uniref:DNA-directed RNA polymerase sigma-70 factor n=1 Tax=Priestia taiwanensis TaxID=1347902 RepID=A0A917AY04_9BACI|nr:sigma-70 family RNA polymerase sigma factor [Priestia taiwanensis]MBM7364746.1 RNA polymerase sigma-70 factor (ECF subfamily) [Priestia taiwanensis]GGE79292.1 DNA-directed RNA polymerase sigma-70 factor [Priestia taiwanensis]
MNEAQMLQGLREKNMDALHLVISTYGGLIYKVINSVLDSAYDKSNIDECMNDVLMTLWYNIDTFDEERGKFTSWLISVSKFKAIDYKRKNNKAYQYEEVNKEGVIEQHVTSFADTPDDESFYTLIECLNEQDRIVFIRRYLQEDTIEEIAADLQLSVDTIYSRLSRGRKRIKQAIGGE